MLSVESHIAGSEKLTGIFGCWPSFHDAEVLAFDFWRGDINSGEDKWEFPAVTAKLRVCDLTQEVGGDGYLVTRNHTLVTIRFSDVEEFRMEGFNHQNAILSLKIERRERTDGPSPYYFIDFNPAFGMGATFHCHSVELLEAVSCPKNVQT